MSQPVSSLRSLFQALQARFGSRPLAVALALLVELLLALILLTLAPNVLEPKEPVPISVFGVSPQAEPLAQDPDPAKPVASVPRPAARPQLQPAEPAPTTM